MNILKEAFIIILNMSITASVVAIGVILIRLLFKSLPKIFSYALWLILLFRLVCPVTISSPLSLFRLIPTALGNLGNKIPDMGQAQVPAVNATNIVAG